MNCNLQSKRFVQKFTTSPNCWLYVMYNDVKDQQELATAANAPYTDVQLINIGLGLIKNMNEFEKGLETWYARPIAEHIWLNLKDHFLEAQEILR